MTQQFVVLRARYAHEPAEVTVAWVGPPVVYLQMDQCVPLSVPRQDPSVTWKGPDRPTPSVVPTVPVSLAQTGAQMLPRQETERTTRSGDVLDASAGRPRIET